MKKPAKRAGNPRWYKGMPSPNPKGVARKLRLPDSSSFGEKLVHEVNERRMLRSLARSAENGDSVAVERYFRAVQEIEYARQAKEARERKQRFAKLRLDEIDLARIIRSKEEGLTIPTDERIRVALACLVDQGANSFAKVVLVKRYDPAMLADDQLQEMQDTLDRRAVLSDRIEKLTRIVEAATAQAEAKLQAALNFRAVRNHQEVYHMAITESGDFKTSKADAEFQLVSKCLSAYRSGDPSRLAKRQDYEAALDQLAEHYAEESGHTVAKSMELILATELGSELYSGLVAAQVQADQQPPAA